MTRPRSVRAPARQKKKLEFACASVDSEIGPIRLTEGPNGIACVELSPASLPSLRKRLERRYHADIELREVKSLEACSELKDYLSGRRRRLSARLDLAHLTDFEARVLKALHAVPFGELVSYGELARRAGKPGAARAVGGAMRKNPIPIWIPCHRVTASDGSLGGFTGGPDKKRWLLGIEGVRFRGSTRI